jgi:hypothetical protein
MAIFGLCVSIGCIVFNALVTYLIYFESINYTIFDQLLLGHILVQLITAIVDIPFYHAMDIFGYWPFPKYSSLLWAMFDNNINFTCNVTMVYICWAQLRSIVEPSKFKDEFLMRYPRTFMALIWVIGLGIWIPIVLVYDTVDYSVNLNYKPLYLQNIFNFLFWFAPLLLMIILSLQIIWILKKRSLRKMHMSRKVNTQTDAGSTINESTATGPGGKSSQSRTVDSSKKNKSVKKKKMALQPHVKMMLISKLYFIFLLFPT